jgi:hypothetical protein
MFGSYEDISEHSGSIQAEDLVNQLRHRRFLKNKPLFHAELLSQYLDQDHFLNVLKP